MVHTKVQKHKRLCVHLWLECNEQWHRDWEKLRLDRSCHEMFHSSRGAVLSHSVMSDSL